MRFTHLHVHSHYSLLDGLPKIAPLISRVKSLGMDSVALTDHGNMYGTIEFYKEANKQGIKPIIGVEAYIAPNKLTDKRPKIDDSSYHLTLLAYNEVGYHHLLKLVSIAHLDGFYYKPRIDRQTLAAHSSGLIALSGCLGGEISEALQEDDAIRAKEILTFYRTTFGDDNYYLEIQDHPTLPEQQKVNRELLQLAKTEGLPLVATKDSHYLELDDREAQDALVCVQTGRLITDTNRLNMTNIDVHFASAEDMAKSFPNQPEAIENSAKIADRCDVDLKLGRWVFPNYQVPEGKTGDDYLQEQAVMGLEKKSGIVSAEAAERLRYELDIISKKGYSTYFLVVADYVTWARAQGIISTTRGSAAGSLVAYAIDITSVNPLEYRLPFERFLNPSRPSPPDIDMDFADDRREEVLQYVKNKYGEDRVAQIITFGTMQARAAVRDIGRVLGYAYSLCDRVAKMIPLGSQGFPMSIERALELNEELKKLSENDLEVARLLNLAKKVEGCARHASVHAAGVVIAPTPLTDYAPLQREAGGDHIVTQYEWHAVEDAGPLKMDFLGVRNLSILGKAVELIESLHDIKIDLNNLPMDDKKTYELLARGETMGLFQLSGSGMTRYLKELRPSTIYDIMAMVALFRPGPMNSIPEYIRRKHDPKKITYLDPRLKTILDRSYGILTYQDDVLLIAIELAGYTWEEADKLRKAIGKKIVSEMAAQKEHFITGCVNHGKVKGEIAEELWKQIEPFAAYGFNKAHAASYGIVAYQTAYLKANYPAEYMTAVLTAESGDLDTVAEIVAECRRMGIEVLPPHINESQENFTRLDDHHIRFGLLAIKNVGVDVTRAIITERETNGLFNTLEEFLVRVSSRSFNKKLLESLIKSGALDEWGDRGILLAAMEDLLSYHKSATNAQETFQGSLFGDTWSSPPPLTLPTSVMVDKRQLLSWERELLGLYITDHPLHEFAASLRDIVVSVRNLRHYRQNDVVAVMGLVEAVRQITTKNNEPMAFVKLSDLTGTTEIVVFPSCFKTSAAHWESGKVLLIAGKVSTRDGEAKVMGETVEELNPDTFVDTLRRWQKLRYPRKEPASGSIDEGVDEVTIDSTAESLL